MQAEINELGSDLARIDAVESEIRDYLQYG
jgi:hypothetical protein